METAVTPRSEGTKVSRVSSSRLDFEGGKVSFSCLYHATTQTCKSGTRLLATDLKHVSLSASRSCWLRGLTLNFTEP